MLDDLFSERMRDEALLRVDGSEKVLRSKRAQVVYALYRYGLEEHREHALPGDRIMAYEPPSLPGRKYWRNAEEFLEFLDAAAAVNEDDGAAGADEGSNVAARRLSAVLDTWNDKVAPIRRHSRTPLPSEDPSGVKRTAYYANVERHAEGRDTFTPAWEGLDPKDLADTARRIVAIECAS